MKALRRLVFHQKPASILIELYRNRREEKYASLLAKRTDCTYSHTVKVLDQLEEHNLVEFEKTGRKKLIELTDKGEEFAKNIYGVVQQAEQLTNNGHA